MIPSRTCSYSCGRYWLSSESGGRLVSYGEPDSFSTLGRMLWTMLSTNLMPNGKPFNLYGTSFYFVGDKCPFLEDWAMLFCLMKEGKVKPIIAGTFPLTEAARLFERGLEFGLNESDFSAAVKRLSILQKRRGDLEEAVRLWEAAARRGHLYAFIELAKFYEHTQRDVKQALKWTQAALKQVEKSDLPAYVRRHWQAEIAHRMERLNHKAGI